ncbi:MAG: bifunctional 5,10-methylenetetrahydrofolate dehydrogenase/5,10-methenyltetrahydrofolate cyclohydrolase [Alphaproteobacteria bacterium]|nr:bifunctional 5,10-methylenetetrahydrofolate dehydrogenase/5,10-methenyltetrahydrofolate cyclohydrolase [Rickettsiales bacterium]
MTNIAPTKDVIKRITNKILQKITETTEAITSITDEKPKATIFAIDPTPPSLIYMNKKILQSAKCGIVSEIKTFSSKIPEEEIKQAILKCGQVKNINGIMLQLPIPEIFNKLDIIDLIPANKDIDGLTAIQQGGVALGNMHKYSQLPPTVQGVVYLVKYISGNIVSKNILMIGSSNIVGIPTALTMLHQGATVTIANSNTVDLPKHCKNADIIISATGQNSLVKEDMIKQDTVIIDVGISRITSKVKKDGEPEYRIVGDVDKSCKTKSQYITPVPGGVGLFTIAFLLKNILIGYIVQNNIMDKKVTQLMEDPIFDPLLARKDMNEYI